MMHARWHEMSDFCEIHSALHMPKGLEDEEQSDDTNAENRQLLGPLEPQPSKQ